MFRVKYLLVLLVIVVIAQNVNAVSDAATINVSLSWNNGTSYTTPKSVLFSCGTGDSTLTYGNDSDLWGRTWSLSEVNDTLFVARLTFAKKDALGVATVDNIKIRIYYTLPTPAPIFVTPTPANASTIGSTLRINVTSTTAMSNCWLSYNATGTWINRTLSTGSSGANCYGTLAGADEGVPTGTPYYFQVWANTSGQINSSQLRQVTVSSSVPNIIMNSPANNTYYNFAPAVPLNVTFTDAQSDLFDYFIFGGRNITEIFESPLAYDIDQPNSTIIYNWTALPVSRYSDSLRLLYHFDQRTAFGESTTNVFDFSRNNNNGTITNAYINYSGKFGGAYYINITTGKINNSINISFPLTISGWAKFDSRATCAGFMNGHVLSSNGEGLNTLIIQGSSCEEIQVYGNTTYPYLSATPTGYNYTLWNLYTAVSNATGLYLYLNGNQVGNYSGLYMVIPSGVDIGKMRAYPSTTYGLIDEFAMWNRSLLPSEIKDLYRLGNGTYYWNVSAQDSTNGINWSSHKQFTINPLCYYNVSFTTSIPSNVNCEGNDLTFFGSGTIRITSNITNWDTLSIFNPILLKIEEGGSIWL